MALGIFRRARAVAAGAFAATLVACSSDTAEPSGPIPEGFELSVETVASGLNEPLFLTSPPNDGRLFILEKGGLVKIVENGALLAAPFLDISGQVGTDGERGLLGMAFHPSYSTNGIFYLTYAAQNGDFRLERFTVSANDPNLANAASATPLISLAHASPLHYAGMLVFAPDGRLFVSVGDADEPSAGHPQNPGTLYGSLLRLNVSGSSYSVPPDNPFIGVAGARGEIWALGLRNPWRFSIDAATGLVYVADVGSESMEEVNVLPLSPGGANLGWAIVEGTECVIEEACSNPAFTPPATTYSHDDGCAIIGGFVYRGRAIPEIRGHYFYSDFCGGWLRSFRYSGGVPQDGKEWDLPNMGRVSSLGVDSEGELYATNIDGLVYKIVTGG